MNFTSPAFPSRLQSPLTQQQSLSPCPDSSFLLGQVGSNAGIVGMTKEHLGLALALNVPVFVVVTKIDMCPANILQGKRSFQLQQPVGLLMLMQYALLQGLSPAPSASLSVLDLDSASIS